MAKETLFATLSRSPWWLSFAIAAALFAALRLFLPAVVAASASLPFAAIALWAAWKQLRTPGEAAVTGKMEALRELDGEAFSTLMVEGFRRQGYEVTPHSRQGADFELRRDGRKALASSRRWRVAQAGAAPVRELLEAGEQFEADECLFVTAGGLTPQARSLAQERRVRLVEGVELARLIGRLPRAKASSRSA